MIFLCLASAAFTAALPLSEFTLAWTHSIEKIRWEEDYLVQAQGLELAQARIRGTGAGMEAPDGAVLKDGAWHYQPALHALQRLTLARSPYVTDYQLCWAGACHSMAEIVGTVDAAPTVDLFPCDR